MIKGSDSSKYLRVKDKDVWGITYKCASTSMMRALPQPRTYTPLNAGDHVRLIVRDPRDRLVSAWHWFTRNNSDIRAIARSHPVDHKFLMDKHSEFPDWLKTALRHWNGHWVPQTEIHPRWREFELVDIADLHTLGWGHEKKTRPDSTWEQYYDEATLALVNEVYAEDLEMWKEIKDGTDTRTNRIL